VAGSSSFTGAVGADPTAPQEVARRYGINRNLTWKLSRVINASGPFASLNHLPGQQGLELAIGAFENAGASREAVAHVRSAVQRFTEVVQVHAGDREHLELTLESMGLLERETATDSIRELAYRGSSGIWGVQARTRVNTAFVAPSASGPDKYDAALVTGLVGFRRLRPSAEWRLLRQQVTDDKGGSLGPVIDELIPRVSGQLPMMLYEFCSPNMPELTMVSDTGAHDILLPGGQVGNRAAFDCYYGYRALGIPAFRAPGNEVGSFGVAVTLPVESVVFDLIFHRSLKIDEAVESQLYGFPNGGPDYPSKQSVRNQLPMSEASGGACRVAAGADHAPGPGYLPASPSACTSGWAGTPRSSAACASRCPTHRWPRRSSCAGRSPPRVDRPRSQHPVRTRHAASPTPCRGAPPHRGGSSTRPGGRCPEPIILEVVQLIARAPGACGLEVSPARTREHDVPRPLRGLRATRPGPTTRHRTRGGRSPWRCRYGAKSWAAGTRKPRARRGSELSRPWGARGWGRLHSRPGLPPRLGQ